ncbi:MAG: CCA tRNA nucleotidyltransferase [Chloroflexi bacterium]|nr:CCA tRNA nucleotidyltransferase [Chloroflexota bacterium]
MVRVLIEAVERGLPPRSVRFLRAAAALAAREGLSLYLVGGPVRDLLLGKPILDLDLVVEGDAPLLASLLAKELGGTVAATSQFGTAKLKLPDTTLDLATARRETYAHPGALPAVRPGGIRDDLGRRDFTINAMALRLDGDRFGQLLDPFGGQRDVAGGTVRILHPKGFVDDATRILRAIRYEQRLSFHMAETTEALARQHASFLDTISGDRLRHELERLLQEARPEHALARAHSLGVLKALLPSLAWPGALQEAVQRFRESGGRADPLLFLALLATPLSPEEGERFARRLNAPARWRRILHDTVSLRGSQDALQAPELAASTIVRHLRAMEPEAVLAWAAVAPAPLARQRLLHYLEDLRHVRSRLSGHDLLALGVPHGPLVGQLLEELQTASLDGVVRSREEETALVQRRLQEERHGITQRE